MSRIKGKDTKPEILVRKFLFGKGFRFILHSSKLRGKPDLVLPRYKTVINVHGCFWHGHNKCKYFVIPKTRTAWWTNKIEGNKARDKASAKILKEEGWNVVTIWECQLKGSTKENTLNKLFSKLRYGHSKIY